MTSIASWVGIDQRRPSSLYIASDSRITWGSKTPWDHGRKTFASSARPHIFGYWNDVLFPALALPSVIQRIDDGFFGGEDSEFGQAVYETIRALWSTYPPEHRNSFGILHGHRIGEGMACEFILNVIAYDSSGDAWTFRRIDLPETSSFLRIEGSGGKIVRQTHQVWESSDASGTSRAAFSAFTEALRSGQDPLSGGGPQLVGLYRKDPGRTFGTVFGGKRYFAGALVSSDRLWDDRVEWRNELFERVDGATTRRVPGAQVHADRR